MKQIIRGLPFLLAITVAGACHAQSAPPAVGYPNRPVRIVVPTSPGGLWT